MKIFSQITPRSLKLGADNPVQYIYNLNKLVFYLSRISWYLPCRRPLEARVALAMRTGTGKDQQLLSVDQTGKII